MDELLDEKLFDMEEPEPTDDIRSRRRQGSSQRHVLDRLVLELIYGDMAYQMYRYFPSMDSLAIVAGILGYTGYSHLRLAALAAVWIVFAAGTTKDRRMPPSFLSSLSWENRILIVAAAVLLYPLAFYIYRDPDRQRWAAATITVVAIIVPALDSWRKRRIQSPGRLPSDEFKYKIPLETRHYYSDRLGLATIRLLRLHRWHPFQRLRATIENIPLGDARGYHAISYTWGKSRAKNRVLVVDGSAFYCHEATYNALYHFSSVWKSQLVWIDYICIDQSNEEEKGGQVELMRHIYSRAREVRVQMMPPSGQGAVLADTNGVGVLIRRLAWFVSDLNPSPQELVDFLHREIETFGERRWSDLVDFFANPWFTRAWIIQEVVAGSPVEVYYKNRYINWESMSLAAGVISEPELLPLLRRCQNGLQARKNAISFSGVLRIRHFHLKYRTHAPYLHSDPMVLALFQVSLRFKVTPLSFLLSQCSSFEATDLKDKVYALLGLAIDTDFCNRRLLWPNYLKSLPTVLEDTARHLVEGRMYFDVLSYVGVGLRSGVRTPGIPSWVPDWANPSFMCSISCPKIKGIKEN
jgi:hypothetical protein